MSGIPNSSNPKEEEIPIDIDPIEEISFKSPKKKKSTPVYYDNSESFQAFEQTNDYSSDEDSL